MGKAKEYKSGIVDAENLDVEYDFEVTHYQMDENGNYIHELKSDWGGRYPVVNLSWEIVKERIRNAKEKVIKGELSPIAYYMEKTISDVKTLAKYTGFCTWRVKRHMKVNVFKKLSDKTLQRYADFFEITVEQLKDIESLKKSTK